MTRPPKPIDWDKVDQFLEAHCLGTEIAAYFDMHEDTFYRRVQEQYNMGFTEFSQRRKNHGKLQLRTAQFESALEKNTSMMIWLGKQLLDQKEKVDKAEIPEDLKQMVQAIRDCIHPPQLSAKEKAPAEDHTD